MVSATLVHTQNFLGILLSHTFSSSSSPLSLFTLTFICYSSKTMPTVFPIIKTPTKFYQSFSASFSLLTFPFPQSMSKCSPSHLPPLHPWLSLHLFLPLYQTVLPLPFACQLPWQLKSSAHSCSVTNGSLNWDLKTK